MVSSSKVWQTSLRLLWEIDNSIIFQVEAMDFEEISLSRRGPLEEPTSGLKLDLNVDLTQEPLSGSNPDCNKEIIGEATSYMQLPNNAESVAENCCHQNVDGDSQGVIRLNNLHKLARKTPILTHKERRRWLCQQFGLQGRCKRQSNFLNLTEEEMEGIKSRNEILAIRKEAQFRKMLSSYITGVIGDEGIMKEMNELVAKHDHMLAKKRWGLHQRWHKQVFQNINEQVENELKMLTSDQIKDKLRYFHYQYMHASNHRLLFLDVLDNTYYNPLESLKHSIKYNNNFCDPLKHDLDKAKYETFIKSETVSKDVKTRETLDASKWHYSMFRSTIWGHLNADEEDGSQVAVKDLEKWYSHDVLYNTEFADAKIWEEEFPRGKYIVPNQGKGWSFRSKKEGKGKVYGLECMTQPKLQLYYT